MHVWQARYRCAVTKAPAGSIVLLEGVGESVTKTATIVPELLEEEVHIFRPLRFLSRSVMKIAIGELPAPRACQLVLHVGLARCAMTTSWVQGCLFPDRAVT